MSAVLIADKLRASLLQAAIQGKLTKQLPEDGDARDLLKEIEAEKARLIEEKVIRKEKPLPPITEDEIPFEIPENWVWVRFGNITHISSAKRVHQKDWKTEGIPFYRAREIAKLSENVPINNKLFISREHYQELSEYGLLPQENDFMVTGVGTLGKTYIVKNNDVFYYKDASVLHVKNLNSCHPNYFKFYMESDVLKNQILSNSGGTTVSTLTISRYNEYLFPLPPLAEQHRIVEAIETALAKIDKLKTDEDKLYDIQKAFPNKLRASLLQSAIQGQLTEQLPGDGDARDLLKEIEAEKARLIEEKVIRKEKPLPPITEDEIPFEIPENWVWVRLGNILQLISGQDLTTRDYSDKKIGIPYVTGASNFHDGSLEINRWTNSPKSIATEGDLLLTCKGTIGDMAFLLVEKAHIARQVMAISNKTQKLELNFIKIVLENYVQHLKSIAKSMIPGINRSDILSCLVPLPPLAEQYRIVEKLDEILGKVDELNKVAE